jgi:hypothetical protein
VFAAENKDTCPLRGKDKRKREEEKGKEEKQSPKT